MANLKKVLAGSLSLCLAASMFTASATQIHLQHLTRMAAAHQRLATTQASTTALTE